MNSLQRSPNWNLTESEGRRIVEIVRRFSDAEIWLFGSRATGRARRYSDVDICLKSFRLPEGATANIQEGFEESDIPYIVDLSEYSQMTPAFRVEVDRDGIRLA